MIKSPFSKIFTPHRPIAESEAQYSEPKGIKYLGVHARLYKEIDTLSQTPGQLTLLQIPEATDLTKTLDQTVAVSEVGILHEPIKSIDDLKDIKTVSINMNALGGNRQDSTYRKNEMDRVSEDYESMKAVQENMIRFIEFITKNERVNDSAIVTLQDMPIYMMRFLGPKLNELGYSYYANVFGSNGGGEGHMAALVTLVNTKALDGYTIKDASLSITPNFQGGRKVVHQNGEIEYKYGSHQAELEDIKTNYGDNGDDGDYTHNAFQTFNVRLSIVGTDGEKTLVIGNTYNAPWSLQVERSKSVDASLQNLQALRNGGIAINTGDFNTYGVDTTSPQSKLLGQNVHPLSTGLAAVSRQDSKEGKHIKKVAGRNGFATSNSTEPTIEAFDGLVGMNLDHVFASADGDTTVEEVPLGVSFTDHKALFTKITL